MPRCSKEDFHRTSGRQLEEEKENDRKEKENDREEKEKQEASAATTVSPLYIIRFSISSMKLSPMTVGKVLTSCLMWSTA